MFLSFFHDNPAAIARELKKRGRAELIWGNIELAAFATALFVMFLLNWRYVIFFFLPFFYLGHCFSYLNGYFRHYGADPDKPIAWGVSSYGKLYNWLFFTWVITRSIIFVLWCTGRKWNVSINRSRTCSVRKACA